MRHRLSRLLELVLYGTPPLATLLTAPLLARALGPEDRGLYGVATTVCAFALTISAWGQAEIYMSNAARGVRGVRHPSRIALAFAFPVTAVTLVALLALRVPVGAAIATACLIPVLSQANLWRAAAVVFRRFRSAASTGATSAGMRTVGLYGAALPDVLNLTTAIFITQAAAALAAFVTIGRQATRTDDAEEAGYVSLLRSGAAVIVFDCFNAICLRSDLIVLQLTQTSLQVGYFAAPASLSTAFLGLTSGVKARMQVAVVERAPVGRIFRGLATVTAVAAVGAVALAALSGVIVRTLFGQAYAQSIPVLQVIAFSALGLIVFDLAQGVLVVLGARRTLIAVGAVTAVLVLTLLFLLTPIFGALGAAFATAIAYSVSATAAWMLAARLLHQRGQTPPAALPAPADKAGIELVSGDDVGV
jgi:O-antigen/teichoic acid export membrane protein